MASSTNSRLNFFLLWLGQLISQFGDAVFHIALLWLALELTGSNASTGLIATAGYLPAIVLSLAAGLVADRVDRRWLMISCAAIQALVVGMVPVLNGHGLLSGWTLALVAFGVSSGAAFFNPARDALIPNLVQEQKLNRANSFIQISAQMAFLAGPAAAGILVATIGVIPLFSIDAATFVFSAITLLLLRLPKIKTGPLNLGAVALPQVPPLAGSTISEIKAGLHLAWKDRRLRGLLFITAVDNLVIMGPAVVGTPIYVRTVLGFGDKGAGAYATMVSIFFIGMVLMSLVIGMFGRNWPKGKLIVMGMFMDGVTFIPFFFISSFIPACIAMFIHGLTVPLLTVPRATLIQEIVPNESRGRIFALQNLSVVGFSAISTGLTGIIAEWVTMDWIYLAIGLLGASCALAGTRFKSLWQAG